MKNHLFAIYQIPSHQILSAYESPVRNFGFNLKDEVTEIDIAKEGYRLIYNGSIPSTDPEAKSILEELFEIFNIRHPADYHGRSLSVGDIVVVNFRAFHCQSMGWKEINLAN